MLETIFRPGFHMLDQWQVQKFAEVAQRAQVAIYSELEPEAVARAGLIPVADLNEQIRTTMGASGGRRAGRGAAGRADDDPVSGVSAAVSPQDLG